VRIVVVRGSRHSTPFEAVEATNTSLLARFADLPLPSPAHLVCDAPRLDQPLGFAGSLAEQRVIGL